MTTKAEEKKRLLENAARLYSTLECEVRNLLIPSYPLTAYFVSGCATKVMYERHGYGVPWEGLSYEKEGDNWLWLYDRQAFKKTGDELLAHPADFKRILETWKERFATFNKVYEKTATRTFKTQTVFVKAWKQFAEAYLEASAWGLASAIVNFESADEAYEELKERYGRVLEEEKNVLLHPPGETTSVAVHSSLLRIAQALREKRVTTLAQAREDNATNELLREHQQTFRWLHTNYHDAPPLSLQEVFDEAVLVGKKKSVRALDAEREALKSEPVRAGERRRSLCNDLGMRKEDAALVSTLAESSLLQDERKRMNQMANHLIFELVDVAARLWQRPKEELLVMLPEEFLAYMTTGREPNPAVSERQEGCFVVAHHTKGVHVFVGEAYRLAHERFAPRPTTVDVLHGFCANKGRVVGPVRVIRDVYKEGASFREGDVLVTSMTRPEFLPLMKKAVAVVTNEGGVTSHAAILSRELGKPCVVNTKRATLTFKDGDLVEVDAEKGVVRKVKS